MIGLEGLKHCLAECIDLWFFGNTVWLSNLNGVEIGKHINEISCETLKLFDYNCYDDLRS